MALEEKKRLEARITALEDQLEEIQSAMDATEERHKRAYCQMEQAQTDLSVEKNNFLRSECQRVSLEKTGTFFKVVNCYITSNKLIFDFPQLWFHFLFAYGILGERITR